MDDFGWQQETLDAMHSFGEEDEMTPEELDAVDLADFDDMSGASYLEGTEESGRER